MAQFAVLTCGLVYGMSSMGSKVLSDRPKSALGRRVVCEPVRWSREGAMMIGNGEVVNTGKVSVLSASLDLRVSTRPKWRKTWEKRNEGLSVKP